MNVDQPMIEIRCSSQSTMSDEEIEIQTLVEHGKVDQAIGIYRSLQPTSGRILHHLGVMYSEHKGDYPSAINYFTQALKVKEQVYSIANSFSS